MMINRKILFAAILILFLCIGKVFAEPIVELAAPRIQPTILNDNGINPSKPGAPAKKSKRAASALRHKQLKHKKIIIVVDYNKVSRMIENGYYDDADIVLTGAIARNSKDTHAQSLYAVSLAKQFKLDKAQTNLNVLLKTYPNNSNLHYAQGIVYYQRTNSSNMIYRNSAPELLKSAYSEFKKAVELDKNNARAYNALGVIAIKNGNTTDASNYFKKAVSIDKTYSMAIDNLGTLDFAAGNYKEAEKKFKQAISYNSTNSTALYHLAQISLQKQNYTSALSYLNTAISINPYSAALYNLIGKVYYAQGNEAAAINAYKKSITITPEFSLSYIDLADIYERRGDKEFAIEQLKTALSVDSNLYDARLKIADISLQNSDYKQAIDAYCQLIGVNGYNDAALKGLANSYYAQAQVLSAKSQIGSMKDLYSALDAINKAIAADTMLGNIDLELHLAKLKLTKLTNQPDQSKIELNKIVNSKSTDLASYVVKGEAYLAMHNYSEAQKSFDKAVSMSKSSADDAYLAEIMLYCKQYDEAEKVLNKILKYDYQNQSALNSLDYIKKCKKYSNSYYNSATCFLKDDNVSSAIEYLYKSISVNPNNPQARLLLGQIFEKRKEYNEALSNYKAYLGLLPNGSEALKVRKKIAKLDNKI